jgi:hypothetical protein
VSDDVEHVGSVVAAENDRVDGNGFGTEPDFIEEFDATNMRIQNALDEGVPV